MLPTVRCETSDNSKEKIKWFWFSSVNYILNCKIYFFAWNKFLKLDYKIFIHTFIVWYKVQHCKWREIRGFLTAPLTDLLTRRLICATILFKTREYSVLTMTASLTTVVTKFYEEYAKTTPSKLKLIDAYLFYILLTGVVQFLYCCLVGTFPFNSFLSGFISCVGSFVLAGKLILLPSPIFF